MISCSCRGLAALCSLWLLACATGCQLLGGLQVEAVETQASKPSNVNVYLSVQNGDEPLTDLQVDNFRLTENEKPLDADQVGLRLLDRNTVATHRVLVLLDLSGPIEESGALPLLTTQLIPLLERLRADHAVSVFGFDGSEDLTYFGSFERAGSESSKPQVTKQDLSRLTTFKQKDASSNLHGAVSKALTQLGTELARAEKPIALGSLFIIARGPDLAGRTPEALMVDKINDSPYQVYAVTVGKEDDTRLPEILGPAGHAQVKHFENLEVGLAEVARRVESAYDRYYFLSYCSPSRAGERNLVITVSTRDGDGAEVKGDLSVNFNASGFGSGCDSSVPSFRRSASRGAGKEVTPSVHTVETSASATPSDTTPNGASQGGSSAGDSTSDVVPPPNGSDYAD